MKAFPEAIRGGALTGLCDLCVEPNRQSRIGMTETFLRCLDIDPFLHERGRVRAAKIVELQSGAPDYERRGHPNTVIPIAVVEAFPSLFTKRSSLESREPTPRATM